ncbi:MAG: NotI family restriction endonuclease, partial [Candidatus Binatia bacterium]
LELNERLSTDANGIATCLGLQTSARIELETILAQITAKLPTSTPLTVGGMVDGVPVPATADAAADDES